MVSMLSATTLWSDINNSTGRLQHHSVQLVLQKTYLDAEQGTWTLFGTHAEDPYSGSAAICITIPSIVSHTDSPGALAGEGGHGAHQQGPAHPRPTWQAGS
jgi:hypothetical protein